MLRVTQPAWHYRKRPTVGVRIPISRPRRPFGSLPLGAPKPLADPISGSPWSERARETLRTPTQRGLAQAPKGVMQKEVFPLSFLMAIEPMDASVTARDLQEEAHIRLGPEGRLRTAFDLSEAVRDLRLAGIRSSYPDASEGELIRQFLFEAHGLHPEVTS